MNRRSSTKSRAATQRRARARGFTLVEILVALSAGVLVSAAAFAMSKNASTFFQHEARISSAQLALTLGMNRITADLQRASFLTSPNPKVDPMVCHDPSWATLTGLNAFAGITLQAGVAAPQNAANFPGTPDQLIVGGSLDTAEVFVVQCVVAGAGGGGLDLQLQSPLYDNAMARMVQLYGPGPSLATALGAQTNGFYSGIFVPGRYVNLLDPGTGYRYFGVVQALPTVDANNVATIYLAGAPAIPSKPASPCGLLPVPQCGQGLLLSAVSRVLYDVRSLQGYAGTIGAMVTPPSAALGTATGESGRTELVRVELDSAGNERTDIPLELVSEFAVDMRFGLTVATPIVNDNYNPTNKTYDVGDTTDTYHYAGNLGVTATAKPQLVRAVQVRLATRSRAGDRDGDVLVAPGYAGTDNRRLRFDLGATVLPRYVRLRTGYADVLLPNQGGFSLW